MDLIFCKLVLTEILEWRKAVSEITRVTRKGGRIIIIDFHSYNPEWQQRSGDAHPGFDPEEIVDNLVTNGCAILQIIHDVDIRQIGSINGDILHVGVFLIEAGK